MNFFFVATSYNHDNQVNIKHCEYPRNKICLSLFQENDHNKKNKFWEPNCIEVLNSQNGKHSVWILISEILINLSFQFCCLLLIFEKVVYCVQRRHNYQNEQIKSVWCMSKINTFIWPFIKQIRVSFCALLL